MTTNYLGNWSKYKSVYKNPNIIDTPMERRPNNPIGAIDHFSKKAILRKYNNPEGYVHADGIPTMGNYTPIDFWCVIKPATRGAINREGLKLISDIDGEHTDGQWALFYNPFHEKHGEVHLSLSDENGFSDVIEFQNELWKVTNLLKLDIDYGEDEINYIGKCIIKKWTEPNHVQQTNESTQTVGHYELK